MTSNNFIHNTQSECDKGDKPMNDFQYEQIHFELVQITKHLQKIRLSTNQKNEVRFGALENELKQANITLREIYWGFDIKLYILLGLLALILWRVW